MTITKEGIFVSDERQPEEDHYDSIGHLVLESLSDEVISRSVLFVDASSGRDWTGAQLKAKILSVSAALVDLYHFEKGTSVCIDYDHTDHTVILALAVIVAGGVVASAFPKDPYAGQKFQFIGFRLSEQTKAELLYLAKKVRPKFLFCHQKTIGWAKQLARDLNYEVKAIAMDGDHSSSFTPEGEEHFSRLLEYDYSKSPSKKLLPVACEDSTSDLAFITMSSGTTGQPKAIPVTHSMVIADKFGTTKAQNGFQITISFTASLDYVSGRCRMMNTIRSGNRAIIMNGFDPKLMLGAIEKYKINVMYLGAASFYNLITYKDLDTYDISSLISAFPIGAKITYLKELRDFLDKHTHIRTMNQGFGTSETCSVAIIRRTPDEFLADCELCGKLVADRQAKIVDPNTGKLMGPNEIGMLHVKGSTVFPGYYDVSKLQEIDQNCNVENLGSNVDRKKFNQKFLRDSSTFDEDGFYITGDMAYFNEKEELYCVGRKKELMSCRGAKKVLPNEIEVILLEHPAVLKACVLGIPNKIELTLHCPRAYVCVRPICYQIDSELPLAQPSGSKPKENLEYKGQRNELCSLPAGRQHKLLEDIMEFLNERIGWEKQLTGGLILIDEMPTLRETGKINKCYLRSLSSDLVEIYGDRSE